MAGCAIELSKETRAIQTKHQKVSTNHIAATDAALRLLEQKRARARGVSPPGAGWVGEVEAWQRDPAAPRARRVAALATLQRLQIIVAKAQIRAPFDATVIARFANAGQM